MQLYELLWHSLPIMVIRNTINHLNMGLGTICLKDKKQKKLFHLLWSTTFLCVCMHTSEVQDTILIPSWHDLINSTCFCNSAWSIQLFSVYSRLDMLQKCTYTKKENPVLASSLNDLRAMMLLLCWCCFLAMQVWTWPLQNVREMCRCVAILISGEEQVYFRKINCREDNHLRDTKKPHKPTQVKITFAVAAKCWEGTWRRGLSLWLWVK